MEEIYFVVPLSKLHVIESKRCRLLELFAVEISVYQGSLQETGSDSTVKILLTHTFPNKDASKVTQKAKAYIQSLTGLCEDFCTCIESYEHEVYRHLQTHHNDIERESQAVLRFTPDCATVHISGQSFNVAIAKSVMERLRYALETSSTTTNRLLVATNSGGSVEGGGGLRMSGPLTSGQGEEYSPCHNINTGSNNHHSTVIHTLSPGGESSHDSCYDSDCSPTSSRRNSSHRLEADLHTDISRTTSDTLGEELSEDSKPSDHVTSSSSGSTEKSNGSGKGYTSKVEFALKLGYTENQIGSVLDKLGANVDQNELLGELIKLGSSNERVSSSLDKKSQQVPGSSVVDSFHSSDLCIEKGRGHAPLEKKSSGSHRDDSVTNLRPIVIDGSNVAMSHGNKEVFSCQGIKLAVDFFKQRRHTEVTVFVPQWRKETSRNDSPITGQDVLYELEKEKILVFTPARRVGGKRVICYDDRYIVKLAAENGGIVVSNDNYRDLLNESPEYKEVIEQRLLMYSFVNDRFMPPDDPLGRHGPLLDQFLQKEPVLQEPLPPVCPYGKKCTYGNKCKYYHPERGSAPHKSVTDRLKEEASMRLKQAKEKGLLTATNSIGDTRSFGMQSKKPLGKTKSVQPTQPKRALTRTQSLVPGVTSSMPGGDSGHHKGPDSDKLDIHSNHSPASSRSLSPSLMVTPAPIDGKPDRGGRSSNHASPKRSASPRDLSATAPGRLDSSLRIQPEHLSVVHEVLRPVLSDPTSGFYKDLASGQRMAIGTNRRVDGDDLVMGTGHHVPRAYLDQHGQYLTKAASASEVNETDGQAMHRRLQRQLSLKGAEDPRILQKTNKPPPRENVPSFTFHGPMALQHHRQQHPQQPPALIPAPLQFMDPYRLAMFQNMQVQRDAELQKKQSLGGGGSMPQQQAETEAAANRRMQQHLNATLMPPESLKSHQPLGKMPSAPGAFAQSESRSQISGAPRMNRQNSTSDSSLHQTKDLGLAEAESNYPGMFGDPRWAFQGSISGQQVREPFEQNTKQDLFTSHQPPDRFYLMPDGSKHFPQATEADLGRPGIKVEFGPCSERQQPFVPPGRATPGAPAVNMVQHQPQKSGDHSPIRSHQGLQRKASRNTSGQDSATGPVMMGNPGVQGMVAGTSGRPPNNGENEQAPSPGHSVEMMPAEDARHQIYFHLSGLFDEKKVLQVMTAHPEETNPQVLCAYLIGMN